MSTSISKTSTESRVPRVVVKRQTRDGSGRIRSTRVLKDARSAGVRLHHPVVYTQNVQCPSNFFMGSAKLSARMDGSAFHRIRDLVLRFDITHTSAPGGATCPPWLWIDRIELYSSNGSQFLGTIFGDLIPFYWQAQYETGSYDAIARAANPGATDPWYEHSFTGNEQRTIYIPLTATLLSQAYMNSPQQSDLVFQIFPRSPYTVASADNPSIAVNSMQFLVYSDKPTSADAAATAALHKSVITETSYLEPTRLVLANKSVAPQQALRVELDVISGAVAALIVLLRPATGPGAHATFHSFASGKLDLRSPGGESIYGSGTQVDEDYLREVVQSGYFNTSLAEKMPHVLMSFCDDPRAATAFGHRAGGSLHFSNDKTHLSITPGADFVAGQYDITCYALRFKSCFERDGKRNTSD